MTQSYTLYIDESGDEGLLNIWNPISQKGACPQFFLGGVLISNLHESMIKDSISKIEGAIGGRIHCSHLSHEKKSFICKELAKLPITCFALISDKSGLERKGYGKTISSDDFYNKNVKYLLEKVGKFCALNKIKIGKIILEKKGSKNYSKLRRYLLIVQNNPLHEESKFLEFLELGNLIEKSKSEESILKISDCIAHAMYKASIPNLYGLTEHRYLLEIKERFFSNPQGIIFNFGIKFVPDIYGLKIGNEDIQFLSTISKTIESEKSQSA